uniref:Secreted protein n=1 Tax=Steinernema glaseri TaxID=37863 RepID=A0A1I8AC06_9BILA
MKSVVILLLVAGVIALDIPSNLQDFYPRRRGCVIKVDKDLPQKMYFYIKNYWEHIKCGSDLEVSSPSKDLGKLVLTGVTHLTIKSDREALLIKVRMHNESYTSSPVPRRKYGFATIKMPFNQIRHEHLKNVVSCYMSALYEHFDVPDVTKYDVLYEKDVIPYIEETIQLPQLGTNLRN